MGGWTWYYGLLNFLILAAGLYLVGRKIVAKMFREYREKIARGLEIAHEAESQAAESAETLGQRQNQSEDEARRILDRAHEKAEEELRQAQEEEKRLIEAAQIELNHEKEQLLEQVQRHIEIEAASELVGEAHILLSGLDEEQKQRLNSECAQRLAERFNVTRYDKARIKDGQTLQVSAVAAAAFSGDDRDMLRSILNEKTGGAAVAVFSGEEPKLLGGARVRVGDTVYDGSLLHKLERARIAIEKCRIGDGDAAEKIKEVIETLDTEMDVYQSGGVVKLLDGICQVSGLGDVMVGETVEFPGGLQGMVLDLSRDSVGVVMLGDYGDVQEGDEVRRTGHIIQVPVGEAMLGRVVDALGRPVDGKGDIHTVLTRPVENPAPGVIDRKSVSVPLQTGVKAVDTLIPIGRGQRELIIGDRQTGKTAIAVDTIINQKDKDVICVYVAIGQKESTVSALVEELKLHGAMDYTTVVCANASEPAPLLYIAPYSGCAMAEYFMYNGRDVLVVYDDLTKQAVAYREISLLLQRPPGREAFPGDIFYIHSRLLERAARLNEERGGGSMTALPIVETQGGDISAYIPTNVISITDGQMFLSTELFNSGVRPAINAGLSVSRVGGSAQLGAMKQVAASLRIRLAQYRELEAFAQFGSEMDKATRDALNRGDRLTELLKQPQFSPADAASQVVSVFAMNEGFGDSVELKDVLTFEKELVEFVFSRWPELKAIIMSGSKLSKAQLDRLRRLTDEFKHRWSAD